MRAPGDVPSGRRRQPELLRLGTEFGLKIAREYGIGIEDVEVKTNVGVPKGRGTARWDDRGQRVDARADQAWSAGFIDILVTGIDPETGKPFRVVIEVKNTGWDESAAHRVRPNVNRHRLQVWGYLEPMMEHVDAGRLAWVEGSLLYPRRPSVAGRDEEIESLLGPWGVTVAYATELS